MEKKIKIKIIINKKLFKLFTWTLIEIQPLIGKEVETQDDILP